MNKSQIKALAKKLFRGGETIRTPQLMHPNREWGLGLFVSLLLFVGIAGWSYWLYTQFTSVVVSTEVTGTETAVVYRASMVETALTIFSNRATTINSLLEPTQTPSTPLPENEPAPATPATTTEPITTTPEAIESEPPTATELAEPAGEDEPLSPTEPSESTPPETPIVTEQIEFE